MVRRLALLGALLAVVVLPSPAALGRSAADDLSIQVQLVSGGAGLQNTKTTSPFQIGFGVEVDAGAPQSMRVRGSLPDGLRWGTDAPDPSEGCTGSSPFTCEGRLEPNAVGTLGGGWYWDVIADRPGVYEVTGSVEGERSDPDPSNNTDTFRFEVVASPSGGGGGGSASVAVSAVKLTPAKPKAGSAVIATASVTAGGEAVKPSKVACTGTLAGKKAIGTGKAATGLASCRYSTAKRAKGKTLAGSMTITAKGKTITKRFAAKLG